MFAGLTDEHVKNGPDTLLFGGLPPPIAPGRGDSPTTHRQGPWADYNVLATALTGPVVRTTLLDIGLTLVYTILRRPGGRASKGRHE